MKHYKYLHHLINSIHNDNFSASDGGIFLDSSLRDGLEHGTVGFPAPAPLPGDDKPMPFAIVADDAFPLRSWLQKPYPRRLLSHDEKIFNYRLSRARRVVENAFGILSHRLVLSEDIHVCIMMIPPGTTIAT